MKRTATALFILLPVSVLLHGDSPTKKSPFSSSAAKKAHKEYVSTLEKIDKVCKVAKTVAVKDYVKALKAALKAISGERHVCLEEGEYSEWLYEICEPLAHDVVVVQPEKTRGVKNDAKDAWARADELRRGDLKRPVYKAPGQYHTSSGRLPTDRPAVA